MQYIPIKFNPVLRITRPEPKQVAIDYKQSGLPLSILPDENQFWN